MNRLLTMEIKSCSMCPHCGHDSGDGESPWESDYCKIVMEEERELTFPSADELTYEEWSNIQSKANLTKLGTIPDWCPLPVLPKKN